MKKAIFGVAACLALGQPVFGAVSLSMQFDGPSFGGLGGNASLIAESVLVDSVVESGTTSLWAQCPSNFSCSYAPGFKEVEGITIGSPWDWIGVNASLNLDDSFAVKTSALPGTYFGDARTTGSFGLNVKDADITNLAPGIIFGQRIAFTGPGTYVSAYSPEIVSATWSTVLDVSHLPAGYDLKAETAFKAVLNIVDFGLNRDASFPEMVLYDGSFSGAGAAGFEFRKSDLPPGIDFSNRIGIISIKGQESLTVVALAIPEPNSAALFCLGLGVVGLVAIRRRSSI